MKTMFMLITAIAVAGCGDIGTGSSGAALRAGGPDTCNAAAYAGLIGQDAVTALQIPDPKRSYRPDEAVSTDRVPARVNVQLDDTDTIIGIVCG